VNGAFFAGRRRERGLLLDVMIETMSIVHHAFFLFFSHFHSNKNLTGVLLVEKPGQPEPEGWSLSMAN
jgi:hypothetical protein